MPQERMIRIAVEKISAAKQVREQFDEESIAGLAATLKAQGQLQPVRVRKAGDKYILVDGERRYRAAKVAGLTELDAIVEERELTPDEITERSLVANCQREDLKPLEKARGIAELMKQTGQNASEVSGRLGMSNAMVSRLLGLLELPADIQEQIASGKISPSAAVELAKVRDSRLQSELAGQVASGKLTRDGIAKAAKPKKRSASSAGKPASGRLIAMLGLGRVVSVIAPVLTVETVIELLEDLIAKARKAKGQNLSLATFSRLLEDQARG